MRIDLGTFPTFVFPDKQGCFLFIRFRSIQPRTSLSKFGGDATHALGGAQRGAHRERGERLRSGPLGSGRGTPPEKLQSAYPGRSTPDSSRGGAQRFSAALQDGKEMVALRAGSRRR